MTVEQLCEYLATKCPDDLPVSVGELTSLKVEGVAIHIASFAPNLRHFGAASTIWRPLVRCVMRSKEYFVGAHWGAVLRELFHGFHDEQILAMAQVGTLVYLGRNPERLFEFQVTFSTHIRSD